MLTPRPSPPPMIALIYQLTNSRTHSVTHSVCYPGGIKACGRGGRPNYQHFFAHLDGKPTAPSARQAQCNEEVSIVVPLLGTRICESRMDLECGVLNIRTMCTAVSTFPHTCTPLLFIREPARARQDRLLCLSYTRCIW